MRELKKLNFLSVFVHHRFVVFFLLCLKLKWLNFLAIFKSDMTLKSFKKLIEAGLCKQYFSKKILN